jgi:hypothetical protein
MNPFASNPFELIDRAGLWAVAKAMKAAYALFRVSPILVQHAPRGLFILSGIAMVLADPAEHVVTLVGVLIFAMLCRPQFLADLPAIRSEWDARLYKRYQAQALAERDNFKLRSFLQMVVVLLFVQNIGAFSSIPVFIAVANMGGLLCMFLAFWIDACDRPEPDDGDAFAKPHLA